MHALCIHSIGEAMAHTLTIRNVPEALARKLKSRAERNHRSLQGEVMAIMEQATAANAAQQPEASHRAPTDAKSAAPDADSAAPRPAAVAVGKRLTIQEIWDRGKRLGLSGRNESAHIVRKIRDERDGR